MPGPGLIDNLFSNFHRQNFGYQPVKDPHGVQQEDPAGSGNLQPVSFIGAGIIGHDQIIPGDILHTDLGGVTATQHHTNANDPTAGQKAALAGTVGTPSVSNKYVTDADTRTAVTAGVNDAFAFFMG
jgi:hypothetical protein